MGNNNLLTGTVMLETMWRTRHQDLIDLISPFVFYATASICAPQQIVDKRRVLDRVRSEFGYRDISIPVIERVYKRNPSVFKKHKTDYTLVGSLDKTVEEISKRRDECDQRLQILGLQLSDYLSVHLKRGHKYTTDAAISKLQDFFARQGAFLGANQLEEHASELKGYDTDYYIAQYIFEKKEAEAPEYEYIIDLVKGYFLQTAIYLQAQNGNVISSTYKNVTFYYDTPFLLKLLNYKAEVDNREANELHKALQEQRGSFRFFPQTQKEINNILAAYKRDIGKNSYITLEGLDAKGYTKSDVDRLKATWEANLSSLDNVKIQKSTGYSRRLDGTIDAQYVIDEKGLREYLTSNIRWRAAESMNADIESLINTHQIRGESVSEEIEHVNAIFVTTNSSLARYFNRYYREKVNSQTFPLVITDSDLAALTWIKCGSTNSLPEKQLLRNAYMATQPTPEMLDQFGQLLDRMQAEGKVTEEIAVAIRSSRYTQKEILFASFDCEAGIDENIVTRIEAKLREDFSKEAREDAVQEAERQRREEHHQRVAKAEQQARFRATKARDDYLARARKIATGVEIALIIGALIGTVLSWKGLKGLGVFFAFFAFVAVCSVIDTIRGREKIIDRGLVRLANKKYDVVYEAKKKEYDDIVCEMAHRMNKN